MPKTLNHMSMMCASVCSLVLGISFFGSPMHPAMAMELNFNIVAPTTGSISYAGTGGGLVGSNIDVDNVVGTSTPANANVTSTCLSCVLNFTSGSNSSSAGGFWQFASGGSITITGGVDFQGSTPDIAAGSTLLTGSFANAQVVNNGGNFKVTFGSFTDVKHPSLLAYYGMPGGNYDGALTIQFAAQNSGPGNAFTSTSLFSGSITNVPAAVPVPAAAWLFGSGLLGLYSAARRKLSLS
ncbi:MAG: hypothetical protein QM706_12605 [Nitrospira sp.]